MDLREAAEAGGEEAARTAHSQDLRDRVAASGDEPTRRYHYDMQAQLKHHLDDFVIACNSANA